MMPRPIRIGQIVPSSNVTMETEVPAMLRRHAEVTGDAEFTFHSSRMRMKTVDKDALAAMDAESDRCALELSDASVDVIGYACLVAIMATGPNYHCESATRLRAVTLANGAETPIVTSAGALIDGLNAIGARRVSVITPYMRPLTELVVGYLENQSISVCDSLSLEIPGNLEVAAHDQRKLPGYLDSINTEGIDALILSACVQMPSMSVIQTVEDRLGVPVVTAAAATTWQMLCVLGRPTVVPDCGALLSGAY